MTTSTLSQPVGKSVRIDLSAQTFGLWTVLSEYERKPYAGGGANTRWKCRCVCGLEKFVAAGSLRAGTSSGCNKCKMRFCAGESRKRDPETVRVLPGSHYARIRSRAAESGLLFSITHEQAAALLVEQRFTCALSGVRIESGGNCRRTASLDRKDSKVGYVIENVQWVHKSLNMMKGSLTDSAFISWCAAVSRHNEVVHDALR